MIVHIKYPPRPIWWAADDALGARPSHYGVTEPNQVTSTSRTFVFKTEDKEAWQAEMKRRKVPVDTEHTLVQVESLPRVL